MDRSSSWYRVVRTNPAPSGRGVCIPPVGTRREIEVSPRFAGSCDCGPSEVYQCDGFHTYDVIYFIALAISPIYTLLKFDGVVENPIYCVTAVFIYNFLLSTPRAFPAGTIGFTFYEFIKFNMDSSFYLKAYSSF